MLTDTLIRVLLLAETAVGVPGYALPPSGVRRQLRPALAAGSEGDSHACASSECGEFSAKVMTRISHYSHARMEQLRQSPWQAPSGWLAIAATGGRAGLECSGAAADGSRAGAPSAGCSWTCDGDEHAPEPSGPVQPPVAAPGASRGLAATQPAGCTNQQQVPPPEERPHVGSAANCS
jgi:hypothetical protein